MNDAAPAIEVEGLSKRFDATVALDDVTFSIPEGEIRALIGENGAGKSTLVKILAGLVREDTGAIRVFGEDVSIGRPARAHRFGIQTAFQEMTLIDDLTVTQNMLLPYEPLVAGQIDRRGSKRAVVRHFARLDMDDVDPNAMVSDLALSTRQKIEIAKAVAREPRVLLLDEPTSTLSASDVGLAGWPHRQAQHRRRDHRLHLAPDGRGAALLPQPHRAPQRPARGLLRDRRGERRRGGEPRHRPLPRRDLSRARELPPGRCADAGLRGPGAHHRGRAGRSLVPALARRGAGHRRAPGHGPARALRGALRRARRRQRHHRARRPAAHARLAGGRGARRHQHGAGGPQDRGAVPPAHRRRQRLDPDHRPLRVRRLDRPQGRGRRRGRGAERPAGAPARALQDSLLLFRRQPAEDRHRQVAAGAEPGAAHVRPDAGRGHRHQARDLRADPRARQGRRRHPLLPRPRFRSW